MVKINGEYLCRAYNKQFGMKYTIVRPSNVYRLREAPDPEYAHVIPELIRKVLFGNFQLKSMEMDSRQEHLHTIWMQQGYTY
jgi:nucleoside-diphosphate-sugar epimerase